MKWSNKFNLIISIILASFFVFMLNVFAEETHNAYYGITIDEKQIITAGKIAVKGEFDNSDMKVQVIKKTGEDETVLYTGRLGDYENGMWSHTDFSDTQFLVAFDCKYS